VPGKGMAEVSEEWKQIDQRKYNERSQALHLLFYFSLPRII
jgi:hypothetical protein